MSNKTTLAMLNQKMRSIDIAMLSTHTRGGAIASRPMSNNGEVDRDGDSYYFTWEDALMVEDIERNPQVNLAFQGDKHFTIAVEGKAELIRDKSRFKAKWRPELDKWFKNGVDTEGIVLIKVHATRMHYWDGLKSEEIQLESMSVA